MLSLPTTRPRRVAVVGAAVATLATAALVVGPAGAEDAPEPVSVAPTAAQPAPVTAVQSDQYRQLRVLRRARRLSDAMPLSAQRMASPARFGRNPWLSRAIGTPIGKGWVVPGDGTVCILIPDPIDGYAMSCAPTSVVTSAGLTVGLADARRSVAVTLVPDQARVVVTQEDRSVEPQAPDESGVVTTDARQADHVDVTTDEGTASTPMVSSEELAAGATE